jgi:hypothetical protein
LSFDLMNLMLVQRLCLQGVAHMAARHTVTTLAMATLLVWADVALALEWVDGNGQSCDIACAGAGQLPVITGQYTGNGHPFYLCAANAQFEGYRAGYNLREDWDEDCVVGYGTRERKVNPYRCLCAGQIIPSP